MIETKTNEVQNNSGETQPLLPAGFKKCRTCETIKKITEFHYWNNRKSYGNECELCFKKKKKAYSSSIKGKISEKKYRETGKARENWKKWAKQNKDKLKEKNKIYREKNKEKIKAKRNLKIWESQTKIYYKKYREKNKINILKSSRKYTKKLVDNLDEKYCKYLLKEQGFTTEQIEQNQELIEVKRLIIKTKRL